MTSTPTSAESIKTAAARICVNGRVQGVGLRPAVARFADALSLAGYVANTYQGVVIHVEGPPEDVQQFERKLTDRLPDAAQVSSIHCIQTEPASYSSFEIWQSLNSSCEEPIDESPAALSARVPLDVVVCDECLTEAQTPSDRRYSYALTSCSACGPRYSIIERMPFEREQTTMSRFSLCRRCSEEYRASTDRRFHAQTIACPDCGPRIWLRDASGQINGKNADAVRATSAVLRDGHIVALRGIGGYQLLVDATNQQAVERLRQRKQRRGKPLAVMTASLDETAALATLDDDERRLLRDRAGPIVVARIRSGARLADSVTGGLKTVGLMLPTSPLHWLLANEVKRPLVCTSGNIEGEPMVYRAEEARQQLSAVADVWLEHDRPIHRPVDDSVLMVAAGRTVGIRLARGYAPLPIDLGWEETIVAVGGHQKSAIALSNGVQAILGPHVGDMQTLSARKRFIQQASELRELYGVKGCGWVCDCHPEYFTTQWAEQQRPSPYPSPRGRGDQRRRMDRGAKAGYPITEENAPLVWNVQHHHAHVVAGMLEHGWLDRQVLGVAFDGTGYGEDGTIWGGEFLLATATEYERVGRLRPFQLGGGERAVRQPWRVATELVRQAAGPDQSDQLRFQTGDAQRLLAVLQRRALSPVTTSAGRLFDGVAALVLGIEECVFEGQAAMLLEAACDLGASGRYQVPIQSTHLKELDWRPMVSQILRDKAAGVLPSVMAMRFHRGIAEAIMEFCRSYSLPVVLGGGVFQNRLLLELVAERFADSDLPLGLPGLIPPSDGGLAAGQLAVASSRAKQRRTTSCA